MSLQFIKSASLPAEAGCKTWLFYYCLCCEQQHGNKSSKMHFKLQW